MGFIMKKHKLFCALMGTFLLFLLFDVYEKNKKTAMETFNVNAITEEEITDELIIALFIEDITKEINAFYLRWYAAFHNEGHHPHVHLMVYSAKDNDGFLTKAGIEAMRSELAHDIFRQDFAQIYEGQNLARSSLKEKAAERMCLLADGMLQGVCESPIIGEKLQQLSGDRKSVV